MVKTMFKKSKMNLKGKKKKSKLKIIFYLIIVYLSFSYTFYYSIKSSNSISNKEFINLILSSGNANIIKSNSLINIVDDTINYIFNIDFKNPVTILNNELLSTNKKNNEVNILYEDEYSNMEELKKISSYIEDPNPVDINNPIIYIYNSHQLENYSNKNLDIYGITPNVLMASYILKEKLNTMGLSTIVETTNLSDFLNANGWNYASSYKASRLLILNNMSKYNTLKYFIDIHRDSVNKEVATINIDNKSYARILFVVGLEHDNYQKNLDNINTLNKMFEKYYPGLSRGIYKKSGPGVNGIYNQDINEFTMLIEVGTSTNTIDEVFNTIEAISNVLYKYIKGE